MFDAWERYCGYETAMYGAGLEPVVLTHPISGEVDVAQQFVDGGLDAFDALLDHPAKPTAVICYNDLEAFGLLRAARLKASRSASSCPWSALEIWIIRGSLCRR